MKEEEEVSLEGDPMHRWKILNTTAAPISIDNLTPPAEIISKPQWIDCEKDKEISFLNKKINCVHCNKETGIKRYNYSVDLNELKSCYYYCKQCKKKALRE